MSQRTRLGMLIGSSTAITPDPVTSDLREHWRTFSTIKIPECSPTNPRNSPTFLRSRRHSARVGIGGGFDRYPRDRTPAVHARRGRNPPDRRERGDVLSVAPGVRWAEDRAGERLKDLELENSRLRKVVSDLTLDKLILQEAARGNF